MNPSVKVIETEHNGILYRSRLEARWAIFYSALAIPFHYEPEAFLIGGSTGYLPDFYFPQQDCFVEIKPCEPTPEAERKCEAVARFTKKRCFLFHGPLQSQGDACCGSAHYYGEKGGRDHPYFWCRCRGCGVYDIQYDGRSFRISRHLTTCPGNGRRPDEHPDKGYTSSHPSILNAYKLASSHRFT